MGVTPRAAFVRPSARMRLMPAFAAARHILSAEERERTSVSTSSVTGMSS